MKHLDQIIINTNQHYRLSNSNKVQKLIEMNLIRYLSHLLHLSLKLKLKTSKIVNIKLIESYQYQHRR